MKKTHLLAVILIAAAIAGGALYWKKPSESPEYKKLPPKQIYTTIIYCNDANLNDYPVTTAKLFMKDSALIDAFSDVVWYRDSSYQVPVFEDQKDEKGKVKLDSAGKAIKYVRWQDLPKELLLQDYHKNWPLKTP
jgi:hypothetical protein